MPGRPRSAAQGSLSGVLHRATNLPCTSCPWGTISTSTEGDSTPAQTELGCSIRDVGTDGFGEANQHWQGTAERAGRGPNCFYAICQGPQLSWGSTTTIGSWCSSRNPPEDGPNSLAQRDALMFMRPTGRHRQRSPRAPIGVPLFFAREQESQQAEPVRPPDGAGHGSQLRNAGTAAHSTPFFASSDSLAVPLSRRVSSPRIEA